MFTKFSKKKALAEKANSRDFLSHRSESSSSLAEPLTEGSSPLSKPKSSRSERLDAAPKSVDGPDDQSSASGWMNPTMSHLRGKSSKNIPPLSSSPSVSSVLPAAAAAESPPPLNNRPRSALLEHPSSPELSLPHPPSPAPSERADRHSLELLGKTDTSLVGSTEPLPPEPAGAAAAPSSSSLPTTAGDPSKVPKRHLHSRKPPFVDPLDHTPIEGMLKKLGKHSIRGYLLRWFSLEDRDVLYYYKDKGDVNPQGSIHLVGATISEDPKQNDRFTIHTSTDVNPHHDPGRIFLLEAANEIEKRRWLDQLHSRENALDPRNPLFTMDFHPAAKQAPRTARPGSIAHPTPAAIAQKMMPAAPAPVHQFRGSFSPSLTVDLDLTAPTQFTPPRSPFAASQAAGAQEHDAKAFSQGFRTSSSQDAAPAAPREAHLYQVPEYLVMSGLSKALLGKVQDAVAELYAYLKQIPDVGSGQRSAGEVKKLNRLVRGGLSTALARIFNQGFRQDSLLRLLQKNHIWDFILASVGRDEDDESSQFVYRASIVIGAAVKHIDDNHRIPTKSVKFRSLICYGLNEGCLHEWMLLILSNREALLEHYDEIDQSPFHDLTVIQQLGNLLQSLKSFQFNLDLEYEWKV